MASLCPAVVLHSTRTTLPLAAANRPVLLRLARPAALPPCPCCVWSAEQIGLRTFRTRVFLPNNSPVAWADGVHQGGRRSAIAAAALQACKQLHEVCGAGWRCLLGLHTRADEGCRCAFMLVESAVRSCNKVREEGATSRDGCPSHA